MRAHMHPTHSILPSRRRSRVDMRRACACMRAFERGALFFGSRVPFLPEYGSKVSSASGRDGSSAGRDR